MRFSWKLFYSENRVLHLWHLIGFRRAQFRHTQFSHPIVPNCRLLNPCTFKTHAVQNSLCPPSRVSRLPTLEGFAIAPPAHLDLLVPLHCSPATLLLQVAGVVHSPFGLVGAQGGGHVGCYQGHPTFCYCSWLHCTGQQGPSMHPLLSLLGSMLCHTLVQSQVNLWCQHKLVPHSHEECWNFSRSSCCKVFRDSKSR